MRELSQEHGEVNLYNYNKRWNTVQTQLRTTNHCKTPRNGKYKDIVAFNLNHKLDKKHYFEGMKKRHYEHFIKSFTKNLDETNVKLDPEEAEKIMVSHLTSNEDIILKGDEKNGLKNRSKIMRR